MEQTENSREHKETQGSLDYRETAASSGNKETYTCMRFPVDVTWKPCDDDSMNNTTNNASARNSNVNPEVSMLCPTKFNLLNASHVSFAPVQCKSAILFVTGSRQITEFRVDDQGFRALTWVQSQDGKTVELVDYDPASLSSAKLWKSLESLCLSGHARLSDRASVRGVGSDPRSRKECRATDDVSTVTHWIKRSETWLEQRLAGQRKAILGANAALAAGSDAPANDKIPYLPPSREAELADNARVNRVVNANILPQQIIVGGVKHWDHEGALAVRGRRVAGNSSTRTVTGKRELIGRLRDMASRQLTRAAELADSDPETSEECLCFARNSEARAQRLQDELNARMAVAREARRVKREAAIALAPCAAEAVADEANLSGRMALVNKEDAESADDNG